MEAHMNITVFLGSREGRDSAIRSALTELAAWIGEARGGRERRRCVFRKAVGIGGSFARSGMETRPSGENPAASRIARYSGQCAE
jgi:hypothetical protein